jgi:hypothetical protein
VIPKNIQCEDCGRTAVVRGYGRIVYDWTSEEHDPTTLKIKTINLTIDCPRCGVHVQEYSPDAPVENVIWTAQSHPTSISVTRRRR